MIWISSLKVTPRFLSYESVKSWCKAMAASTFGHVAEISFWWVKSERLKISLNHIYYFGLLIWLEASLKLGNGAIHLNIWNKDRNVEYTACQYISNKSQVMTSLSSQIYKDIPIEFEKSLHDKKLSRTSTFGQAANSKSTSS